MNPTDFGGRNRAIDMFRGLTMLLMITVNDLWSVHGVPAWMEHADTFHDGMGLADIVFPIFLLTMGMSIPYAIENRFSKGFSGESTLAHILSRTLALLLMGSFIVNAEGPMVPLLGYGKPVYWLLMTAGFFLIWNRYPENFKAKPWLQTAGAVILAFLALTFRTPDGGLFRASWWGILGLIGWAYAFCAVTWLLCRDKPWKTALVWAVLIIVNMVMTGTRDGGRLGSNWIADFSNALNVGGGSCALMAMTGILLSVGSAKLRNGRSGKRIAIALAAAAVLALGGMLAHKWWIISKNIGTLPWCLYVSAIAVLVYTFLRALEERGMTGWFNAIRPAGTATLTVYMMPYIFYSFYIIMSAGSPEWLSGWIGVLKCVLFSFLCIWTAGLLERLGVKLKI